MPTGGSFQGVAAVVPASRIHAQIWIEIPGCARACAWDVAGIVVKTCRWHHHHSGLHRQDTDHNHDRTHEEDDDKEEEEEGEEDGHNGDDGDYISARGGWS